MLDVRGPRYRCCDGVSRRSFLKVGFLGLAGLTLADHLRLRAAGAATKDTSVILLWLGGGPSHIDMYDLKPEAPAEFRGEFKPIATNVPGVQISEHMPLQARMMDKLAVVRSLVSNDEHSDSYVMTGYTEQVNRAATGGQHPSIGSVISRTRAGANSDVPPFVSL